MEDRKLRPKHTVTMDMREIVNITGVVEVISFDEDMIVIETEMGALILRGNNLHVNKLNLDLGEIAIDGEVENLSYEDARGSSKGRGSLLGRLLK
ncbi:MAG: sporulation protein YabP [Defluviitaleaceae bacterium]|nr:sporulation protein YabP [Defluviitaleaceae bacterium]